MALLDKLKTSPLNEGESDAESGFEFAQDPEPGVRATARRPLKSVKAPAASLSKTAVSKMAKEVSEDLAGLLEMTAAVWGMSDECCAPTLEAQSAPIAEALVGILSRNPRLLAKFADADVVAWTLQTAALMRALSPVAKSVYRNHVSKAVDDDDQGVTSGSGHINLADFSPHRPAFSA